MASAAFGLVLCAACEDSTNGGTADDTPGGGSTVSDASGAGDARVPDSMEAGGITDAGSDDLAEPDAAESGALDAGDVSDAALETDAAPFADAGGEAGAPSPLLGDDMGLTEAADSNPDPDVIEIELEARIEDVEFIPGAPTPAWTYNGGVPGPLIRAKVGDRLIVHFKNSLPEATSIHWHGLRIPNEMDGVPNVTQDPIEAGESFVYDFVLNDAGTFWYHPHANTVEQVGKGLYGPIIVSDPADPDLGFERMIVLSDISLAEDGQFTPSDLGGPLVVTFGREGTVLLVNGKVNPTFEVRAGQRERWRILNAARSRYYSVGLEGQSWVRLGGDNGFAAEPVVIDMPVVVPGERSDVSIAPSGEPGSVSQAQWIPVERGFGSTFFRENEDLFRMRFSEEPALEPRELPPISRAIEPLDVSGATEVALEFTIDFDGEQDIIGINHQAMEDIPPLFAQIGETQIWTLTNHSDFHHPFHLHGYFFQVLDVDGVPILPLEWRDTVDVPIDRTVRVGILFDERPGTWMYHCHILDHAEAGMMGTLVVSDGPPNLDAGVPGHIHPE